MRSQAFFITTVFLSVTGLSHADGPVKAPLSAAQREQIAIKAVTQNVQKWVPSNQKLVVRTALMPFAGNSRNPITGDGPITVYVKQKLTAGTLLQRLAHPFSKFANRQFEVNVDASGGVSFLAMRSLSPQAKLGRAIGKVLPVKQIANDVVTAKKLSELEGWLAAAGTSAAASPATSGISLIGTGIAGLKALNVITTAVNEQKAARAQALKQTIGWIHTTRDAEGAYPQLGQSYQRYISELNTASPGAQPVDLKTFAQQLSINNL
jgi:hypothetical protein